MPLGNPWPIHESEVRSCNGGRHITCSDSKMKVERKAKQNIHDCNEIKTMNAPALLFTQHTISK